MPSEQEIQRWLGEPVEILIVRSDLFVLNKKSYPVMSRAHQAVVLKFLAMGAKIALKCSTADQQCLRNYVEYLNYLIKQDHSRKNNITSGWVSVVSALAYIPCRLFLRLLNVSNCSIPSCAPQIR